MSHERSFLQACLEGECLTDQIEDYIEVWHGIETDLSLADFLGMSSEEYAIWVEYPESLEWILDARRTEKPVSEVIAGFDPQHPLMAARSLEPEDAAKVIEWLKRTKRR